MSLPTMGKLRQGEKPIVRQVWTVGGFSFLRRRGHGPLAVHLLTTFNNVLLFNKSRTLAAVGPLLSLCCQG